MKIATAFGTRPEIIRLSEIVRLLDRHAEHVLIHTGQNYDPLLSDIFFEELRVRTPDVHLGVKADSFAEQAGQIAVVERDHPGRGDEPRGRRPAAAAGVVAVAAGGTERGRGGEDHAGATSRGGGW